jgi:CSLREA domain-containing protein
MSMKRPLSGVLVIGAMLASCLVQAPVGAVTVITVTDTGDPDPATSASTCSLRQAIIAANTNTQTGSCPAGSSDDTIALGPEAYVLSITGSDENGALTGDLDITGPVVIEGAGTKATRVEWELSLPNSQRDRVFDIRGANPAYTVSMSNLTVRRGNTGLSDPLQQEGGGIRLGTVDVAGNTANLSLSHVIIQSNTSPT